MTPRTSVAAAAREIYGELTEAEARASASTSAEETPDLCPKGGGKDLMAQVRALYEDSAVPVREIAARAGVTERTIYKYAGNGGRAICGATRARACWMIQSMDVLIRFWNEHPPGRRNPEIERLRIEALRYERDAVNRARLAVERIRVGMRAAEAAQTPLPTRE